MKRGSLAHIAYLAVIAVKGVDGIIETMLGLAIAIAGPEKFYLAVLAITTPELEEHPASHAVRAIQDGAASLALSASTFAIVYLLVHGVLKSGVVACLLLGQRWIFPYAIAILTAFIVVLLYRMALHPGWWPAALALFDFLTVALIANEWRSGPRRR